MVGDEPLNPAGTYTVASTDYVLLGNGDGLTVFDGDEMPGEELGLDNQILISYITETLGGEIGGDYTDPYGQGRIVIHDGRE